MKFTQDFEGDLETLVGALVKGEHFAFARFGDGESAILRERERPFRVDRDGEDWDSTQVESLTRSALQRSLEYDAPGYYVGTICPACSGQSQGMRESVRAPMERQTYAEIFGNANWHKIKSSLSLLRRSSFLVSSHESADLQISTNLIERYEEIGEVSAELCKMAGTKPVALAAGPASCVIVHSLWSFRQDRTVVDVGSLFDPMLWGKNTRHYMPEGSARGCRVCTWDGHGVGLDTD